MLPNTEAPACIHCVRLSHLVLCCSVGAAVQRTGSYKLITSHPLLTQRVKWLAADPSAGAEHSHQHSDTHARGQGNTHDSANTADMNEQAWEHITEHTHASHHPICIKMNELEWPLLITCTHTHTLLLRWWSTVFMHG